MRETGENLMEPGASNAAAVEQPPGVLRRAIAASGMGNATEWFDYGVYAFAIASVSASASASSTLTGASTCGVRVM